MHTILRTGSDLVRHEGGICTLVSSHAGFRLGLDVISRQNSGMRTRRDVLLRRGHMRVPRRFPRQTARGIFSALPPRFRPSISSASCPIRGLCELNASVNFAFVYSHSPGRVSPPSGSLFCCRALRRNPFPSGRSSLIFLPTGRHRRSTFGRTCVFCLQFGPDS